MEARSKRVLPLFVVLALLSACASFGGGRPEVVLAEDVKVNSLAIYGSAMVWHYGHSREEAPGVYKIVEEARIAFPPAWKALDEAIKSYKVTGDIGPLLKARDVVSAIVLSLQKSGVVK